MSSRASLAVVVLAALSVVLLDGSGLASGASATGRTSVEVAECLRGNRPADRQAVFRGEMRQIAGDARMQMRFALSEKTGRDPWANLSAAGVGIWREARPGVKRFAYRQRVVGLHKGTSYRVKVDFRWIATDGKVVKRTHGRSRVCRQPGKLPNLKARAIFQEPGPTAGTTTYAVGVGNPTSIAPGSFDVELLVDGVKVDTRRVGRLPGGARTRVRLVGPACRSSVEARVDSTQRIREVTETDNVRTVPCG